MDDRLKLDIVLTSSWFRASNFVSCLWSIQQLDAAVYVLLGTGESARTMEDSAIKKTSEAAHCMPSFSTGRFKTLRALFL